MKVILNKDIKDLGSKDDVVEVSDGYARNYLVPRKVASEANANALKNLEKKNARADKKVEAKKEEFKQIAEKLHNLKVDVKADVGEEGKLFGSVTSQDIAAAVKKLIGIDIDKKQILLDEPIKTAGNIDVDVKFTSDIRATLSILVSPK